MKLKNNKLVTAKKIIKYSIVFTFLLYTGQCAQYDVSVNPAGLSNNNNTTTKCGNSIKETGEQCDDGNTTNGDNCSSTCQFESVCGDGVKELIEVCDDGNTTAGDGCSPTCESETCGNGTIETENGEECDDNTASVVCNSNCTATACGDFIVNATAGETCDDGNTTSGDGCSGFCQTEAPITCGNGTCDAATETNANCPDDCPLLGGSCGDGTCDIASETSVTCTLDCSCGDGVCDIFEEGTGTCSTDCSSTYCGDGTCNGTESTTNCYDDCGSLCNDGACNGFETKNGCPADCPENNSYSTATVLTLGTLYNDSISSVGYYSITALADSTYCTITVSNVTNLDVKMSIYYEYVGYYIADKYVNSESGIGSGESSFYPVSQNETFFVKINDANYSIAGSYQIIANCYSGTEPVCGNGILEVTEQCDDGNNTNRDDCSSLCIDEIIDLGSIPLDTIKNGNIDDYHYTHQYSFSATANQIYAIWWNDIYGDGTQTAYVQVSAIGMSSGTEYLSWSLNGYGSKVILPPISETILLKVRTYGTSTTYHGSYQVKVTAPNCGDNTIEFGEVCDDGNNTAGDGCSPWCRLEECANGYLDIGELCDDGDTGNNDGCSAECFIEETISTSIVADNTVHTSAFDAGYDKREYTFNVNAGTLYNIWWNSGNDGDGTQTALLSVTVYNNAGNIMYDINSNYLGDWVNGYSYSIDINPTFTGTVTIVIRPLNLLNSSKGTFQLKVKTPACGDGEIDNTENCEDGNFIDNDGCMANCTFDTVNPIPLTFGQWEDGRLVNTTDVAKYTFPVTAGAGERYVVRWNDELAGDGTQTGDIVVKVTGNTSGTIFINNLTNGFTPIIFASTINENVTVEVRIQNAATVGDLGTFQVYAAQSVCGDAYIDAPLGEKCDDGNIAVSDGCSDLCQVETQTITMDSWINGQITSQIPFKEYIFNVTAGEKYRIYWNDSFEGDASQTLGIKVSANDNSPYNYFTGQTYGYYTPKLINVLNTGVMTITVQPYSAGNTGTFQLYIEQAICGDHIIDTEIGEQCDDGNLLNTDKCSNVCEFIPIGVALDTLYAETMLTDVPAHIFAVSVTSGTTYRVWWNDSVDGNASQTINIQVSAADVTSGTGFFTGINHGYSNIQYFTAINTGDVYVTMEPVTTGTVGIYQFEIQTAFCGDGWVAPGETCDDGNVADDLNGCDAFCQVNNVCGNGVLESAAETCDDGNTVNYDGCSEICQTEPPISIGFETGIPSIFIPDAGGFNWTINTTTFSEGTQSVGASTAINNNESSCMSFDFEGGTSITFDYSIDSELTYDWLRFYINGIQQGQWSGQYPGVWNTISYSLPAAGTAVIDNIKWCYEKDVTQSKGADMGWVDNINIQ
ncbi:MAG: DUF4215 domain-containing protein [Spirochaetia bacterium]|nr:DUF4215 domain-containing protein [Spirochaetia bacterium]